MTRSFGATFDYRCPFARNAHEALVAGLEAGKDWDVRFWAFSLDQAHTEEGDTPVWERDIDDAGSGVRALLWGIAVRDKFPGEFLDFHVGLFAARHDEGQKISDEDVLRKVTEKAGLDPDAVAAEVASGRPAATLAAEHSEAVERHAVFGVPTIIEGEEAVFARLMERGDVERLERVLDLIPDTRLNEFKRTKLPR
ncbi:MAG: DsbA family protein [Acidimicrobiia bacterium]